MHVGGLSAAKYQSTPGSQPKDNDSAVFTTVPHVSLSIPVASGDDSCTANIAHTAARVHFVSFLPQRPYRTTTTTPTRPTRRCYVKVQKRVMVPNFEGLNASKMIVMFTVGFRARVQQRRIYILVNTPHFDHVRRMCRLPPLLLGSAIKCLQKKCYHVSSNRSVGIESLRRRIKTRGGILQVACTHSSPSGFYPAFSFR